MSEPDAPGPAAMPAHGGAAGRAYEVLPVTRMPPGFALSDFDAASRLVAKRREIEAQLEWTTPGWHDAWVLQHSTHPAYPIAASRVRALLEADLAANTAALERLGVRCEP